MPKVKVKIKYKKSLSTHGKVGKKLLREHRKVHTKRGAKLDAAKTNSHTVSTKTFLRLPAKNLRKVDVEGFDTARGTLARHYKKKRKH
jgi:hypothetical protein